jgi:hypothetical protein
VIVLIFIGLACFAADSLNMRRIGYYDTEGVAVDVVPHSPYAFIADTYTGIVTIKIADPTNPSYGHIYNTPGEANSVFLYDTLLYLADMSGGIRLFNVANPIEPIQISRDTIYATYTGVVARGRCAFCALGWSGFTVVDFSNLFHTVEYGPISSLGGYVYSIYLDGDLAYLACGAGGLKIIDVSDPRACYVIGSLGLSGSSRGVFARRDTVFVAGFDAGLHIIDAANPASPTLISTFNTAGYAMGVWAEDTITFVADYGHGLRAINIYDPQTPFESGFYRTIHNCLNVTVKEGYIFASFGDDGLYILDGGLQLNAPATIDSVWMLEDCVPEPSSVHVCYELIDPENDSVLVGARMSSDGGATWNVPFYALYETEGTLGNNTLSGVNCFRWAMAEDLPNSDDKYFTCEIYSISPSLRHFTVSGKSCPYWAGMPYGTELTDSWGGDTIPTVAPVRIDIAPDVDSVIITASGTVSYGDEYPFYGPNGGSPTPTIPEYGAMAGISYFTDCPIVGLVAVFLAPGQPSSLSMPPQLSSFSSTPEIQQSVFIGSGPSVLIPPEGSNRLFLGVNDNYRWQDNIGHFDVEVKIFYSNSYSYGRASDSLDSKPPEIALECPTSPLVAGMEYEFNWNRTDRSPFAEFSEIAFRKGSLAETHESPGNSFMWRVSPDFVPDCTLTVTVWDSFCNPAIDTCYLSVLEPALACTAWVDSVWFSEEINCDRQNIIQICYNLIATCPDSFFYTSVRASTDSGSTWSITLSTLFGHSGNLGNVLPGVHCFSWDIGADRPNIELTDLAIEIGVSVDFDTFLVIDSIDVSARPNYGRGMGYGDGWYFIYDYDRGYIYKTSCIGCPPADSFYVVAGNNCDIDYADGYIYYADSTGGDCHRLRRINVSTGVNERIGRLPEYASDIEGVHVIGDSLIVAWLGFEATWTTPEVPNMLLYLDLTRPFPITEWETLFVSPFDECHTIEGMAFAHGRLWGSNDFGRIIEIDLDAMAYVGCYPAPNVGEGAEGLCFDGEYMWFHNYNTTGTKKIYQIQLWDSFVNSAIAYGPADTRPPRVSINCPSDSIRAGVPYNITWSVEDLFHAANPCSVHIFGCENERHNYVSGTTVNWMNPWECPACTIVVVTRDSFCNWGSDTCVVRVYRPAPPCSVFIDSVWFAQETDCFDKGLVRICYDFHSACPDSGYFATVLGSTNGGTSWMVAIDSTFDDVGDLGMGTIPGVHCFYWDAGYDFPGWEGDNFSIRIDVAGHGYNSFAIAAGMIDTKPPSVAISCPTDTIPAGIPYNFTWTLDDAYYSGDPCSVTVRGCGIWERHEVEGLLFTWVAPWACSTYSIILAVRDSFCNWGADTCYFTVSGDEPTCSAWVANFRFNQETLCNDSSIVEICYDLLSSCPDSAYNISLLGSTDGDAWSIALNTLFAHSGDIGDSVFAGSHCFYWNAGRDLPAWEGDFAILLELRTIGAGSLLGNYYAHNPVDTDPPTIILTCPESPMFSGDTAVWTWSIDDLFPVEDYFEVYLNWCAGETNLTLDSSAFHWVIPPEAEGCNIQFAVAGRDSFCNWNTDTCWTRIDTTELRCKVLIYSNSLNSGSYTIYDFDSLISALEAQGNEVTAYGASDGITITPDLLGNYSQFWFIDSKNSLDTTLSWSEVAAIRDYLRSGRGVSILADHYPYYTRDAAYILAQFNISLTGSVNHRTESLCNSEIDFASHYLTRGLYRLACFTSEARIRYTGTGDFRPLSTFAGDTLQAALIDGGRLFVDASFFRYLDTYHHQCDGRLLTENIACWIEPNGCGCEIESCMVEVVAQAEDSAICFMQNASLSASVSGASGLTSYNWWSSPSGFASTSQNPTFGPLTQDIWFFVRATDEAGCVDIDSVYINVLVHEVRDTFMCLGDTMTFCESPMCGDSGPMTRGAISVTQDGIAVYGSIIMDEDSSCMDFIPLNIGGFIVCHEDYYDIDNDCCYDICWHVTVCCAPRAELLTDVSGDCSWSFSLASVPGSDCTWDSVSWTAESFFGGSIDTTLWGETIDLTIHGTDSVEICAVVGAQCTGLEYCYTRICTTLNCVNEFCCTLQITIDYDSLCAGETAYLCAILQGDDCPATDSLHGEWTANGLIIGSSACISHIPDSTTSYCYNVNYENSLGEICILSHCATVYVVPQPPDVWPEIVYVPLGEALELTIPCREFGDGFIPDSIVVLEYPIGAPSEEVRTFYPGDWCVFRRTLSEPTTTVFCYDFFANGCEWYSLECCTVYTCLYPSVELTTPLGICPENGTVRVCVHNTTPEISIDVITWSNGATTVCTNYPITPIATPCGGINSFVPKTVFANICNNCFGVMSCVTETLVITPVYSFSMNILPPGVTPGDSVNTRPRLDPPPSTSADSLIDWFICSGDSMIYHGSTRYPDGIRGATSLYDKTVYCAQFTYGYGDSICTITACDSVFVQDTLLTIIKTPCAFDPDGWIEADSYRRYATCNFTFPVDGHCIIICASDTDFVMPNAYVFDHWATNAGIYSYASCTTFCPASAHDTLYAVYEIAEICLHFAMNPGEIAIDIEEVLVADDSAFSRDNIVQNRGFLLQNCGGTPLDLALRWVGAENISDYDCPPVLISNSNTLEINTISVRARLTDETFPRDYVVVRDDFTSVLHPLETPFVPGDNMTLFVGIASPPAYHPCYPPEAEFEYRIALKLRWGVYLP